MKQHYDSRMSLKFMAFILFSVKRAGSDVLLYGDQLVTPDDNVPTVFADHRGLRLHSPGLHLVQVSDPGLGRGRFSFYTHYFMGTYMQYVCY